MSAEEVTSPPPAHSDVKSPDSNTENQAPLDPETAQISVRALVSVSI